MIEFPELPYALNALAPHISEETLEYHYGKHHRSYVSKLNKAIDGTPMADGSLEEIVKQASGGLFNNAAQAFNHDFYWKSMSPNGGGKPSGALADLLTQGFGSVEAFQEQFTQTALTTFGSGWAWLVVDAAGAPSIVSTSNAGTPLTAGQKPLLTCDVWEHAYYVDYRNDRAQYVKAFWELVNWEFAAAQLAG